MRPHRLPALRDTERLDAWIFQIARNVLADSFRHRRRASGKVTDYVPRNCG